MASSVALIEKIAEKLKEYQAENIVVDPVMVATSGAKLISEDAIDALKTYLLPMATVLTPNIPEAEILSGMKIEREEAMIEAAKLISENYHCAVLFSSFLLNFCKIRINFILPLKAGDRKWCPRSAALFLISFLWFYHVLAILTVVFQYLP